MILTQVDVEAMTLHHSLLLTLASHADLAKVEPRKLQLLPTLLVLLTKLSTPWDQTNAIHLPNALVTDTAKLVDGAREKATVDLYFPQDCDNRILNKSFS